VDAPARFPLAGTTCQPALGNPENRLGIEQIFNVHRSDSLVLQHVGCRVQYCMYVGASPSTPTLRALPLGGIISRIPLPVVCDIRRKVPCNNGVQNTAVVQEADWHVRKEEMGDDGASQWRDTAAGV
jgi:hypothetical protein